MMTVRRSFRPLHGIRVTSGTAPVGSLEDEAKAWLESLLPTLGSARA